MTQSLHPSAAQGFSQSAELYQSARPNYPEALRGFIQSSLAHIAQPVCVDLGAGTGKFLPYLQQITANIVAIEPITAMLEQLQLTYPDIETRQAFSHDTSLASSSVDAVFCAQSFHWFSSYETLQEIARILKPQGHLFLIWNQRDDEIDWVQALSHSLTALEVGTPRYHTGEWQQVFDQQTLFQLQTQRCFPHQHMGDVETVVSKRLLSTSFIAALPSEQQQQLKLSFEKIVQDYTGKQPNDTLAMPYLSHIYHYQKQH